MENENSFIYGLEFQARALAAQLAETEKIRFLIGTQSLKQTNNQIHLVEFDEENSKLDTKVHYHSYGEIWKLTTSPVNPMLLATCYNTLDMSGTGCNMKASLLKLPDPASVNPDIIENLPLACDLIGADESVVAGDVRTTEFHPTDETRVCTVVDNAVVVMDVGEAQGMVVVEIKLEGKSSPRFITGKWNPHQNCNQFTASHETHLKTYDIRTKQIAWQIDGAHTQVVRDMDFNMNKQYHIATCSDDGFVKIWDFRQCSAPVYSRSDHSHWIWCVRFNPFHDQLLLTASSDARVLLSGAASVSSENVKDDTLINEAGIEPKQIVSDGPLQWCEHEDSVYCAEWSPAEPWIFASLSYDGRLLISRVKKSLKYQIML